MTWQIKETKNDIHQLRTKLSKAQIVKQTKAMCQMGNKATKTKQTNKYGEKEKGNKEKKE